MRWRNSSKTQTPDEGTCACALYSRVTKMTVTWFSRLGRGVSKVALLTVCMVHMDHPEQALAYYGTAVSFLTE